MTTIMIAHRLQTIKTAEHLLYLEEPDKVRSAQKGTAEYDEIIAKLEKTNYAHQQQQDSAQDDIQVDDKKKLKKSINSQVSLLTQQSLKDTNKQNQDQL